MIISGWSISLSALASQLRSSQHPLNVGPARGNPRGIVPRFDVDPLADLENDSKTDNESDNCRTWLK